MSKSKEVTENKIVQLTKKEVNKVLDKELEKESTEAKEVLVKNLSEMSDDELLEMTGKVNADAIVEKSISSGLIWKPELTQVNGERNKAKVRKLRTDQMDLCEALNKWQEVKNAVNLSASVLLLYSFSKKNLCDVKNYMGGKRKEVNATKINKAYKYMLEQI